MALPVVKAGYWYCDSELPIPVGGIPSGFFTHLFAAFAHVDPITYEVTFPDAYRVQFSTFTQIVQQGNKDVKTLLSIGGAGVSSSPTFALMARQRNTRQSFIDSSIRLARSNNFHGLSLNWQYPSTPDEMENFGLLLDQWREAVNQDSNRNTVKDRLLLVAAVNFRPTYKSLNYPVVAISRSLDWINVLAYDFYSPDLSWNVTGPFAALYNAENPHFGDAGVTAWLAAPVPPQQIVFGLPFYGYAWRLKDGADKILFPPADGPADGPANGVHIAADGAIFYNQILIFQKNHPNGRGKYDDVYVFDYFRDGNTWIGYDGPQSITTKVKYARQKKSLLGYFAWHVGADGDNWALSKAAFEA